MKNNFLYTLFTIPVMKINNFHSISKKEKSFLDQQDRQINTGYNFTSANSYILSDKIFSKLAKKINTYVNHYAFDILKFKKTVKPYITQSWANFTPRDTHHHLHNHGNSLFSGVYYLTDDPSPIHFFRPQPLFNSFMPQVEKYTILNCESYTVPPKKGDLLLFPSGLSHKVAKNSHDEERISIAFNVFFKGTIGDNKQKTELILK